MRTLRTVSVMFKKTPRILGATPGTLTPDRRGKPSQSSAVGAWGPAGDGAYAILPKSENRDETYWPLY